MTEEHGDPSEEAGKTVDDLEQQSEKLDEEIDGTKSDWESKKESSGVPGAVPDPDADANDDGAAEADGDADDA